jgi:hypothetical protein
VTLLGSTFTVFRFLYPLALPFETRTGSVHTRKIIFSSKILTLFDGRSTSHLDLVAAEMSRNAITTQSEQFCSLYSYMRPLFYSYYRPFLQEIL